MSPRELDDDEDEPSPAQEREFEAAERALAEMQGKDPNIVRAARLAREREKQAFEGRARRVDERRQEAGAERSIRRRDLATRIGIGLAVLGVVSFVGYGMFVRWRTEGSARALIEPLGAGLVGRGFVLGDVRGLGPGPLAFDTIIDGCAAIVGADSSGPRAVKIGLASPIDAPSTILCTCSPETLKIDVPAGAAVGIFSVAARDVGGIDGLTRSGVTGYTLAPAPPCADAQLAAWPAVSKLTPAPAAAGSLAAILVDRGFSIVDRSPPGLTFAVAPAASKRCLLAVSRDRAATLSASGDLDHPIASGKGSLLVCETKATAHVVRADTPTEITLLSAPSAAVASIIGAREIALEAGAPEPSITLSIDDTAAALRELLTATGALPDSIEQRESFPAAPTLRLLALSRDVRNPPPPSLQSLSCSPPWSIVSPLVICTLPPGRAVDPPGRLTLAVSPPPIWASTLSKVDDPKSMDLLTVTFSLARRLGPRFEATTLVNLKELPAGVEVTGRADEDAIVAVGLSPTPPFVLPFTDGPPWTVSGALRSIELLPGEKIALVAKTYPVSPATTRRTVVFRRSKPR